MKYIISSSNSSKKQQAGVRIKSSDGTVLAAVKCDYSQPWARIKRYALNDERIELVRQLKMCKVPENDIQEIFKM